MKPSTPNRVIALDLHPLSFGYAMFEGPDELIDWGIKNFRHGVNAVKVPMNVKLASLLDQFGADVLVMKEPKKEALKRIARAITILAKRHGIPVRLISCASVRRAFPDDSHNKYQIASVIASRYPELVPRLGPRRKLWQAERYSMSIFDAAAIGIAYFTPEARNDNGNDRTLSPLPR
jgi:hypothetical protein